MFLSRDFYVCVFDKIVMRNGSLVELAGQENRTQCNFRSFDKFGGVKELTSHLALYYTNLRLNLKSTKPPGCAWNLLTDLKAVPVWSVMKTVLFLIYVWSSTVAPFLSGLIFTPFR